MRVEPGRADRDPRPRPGALLADPSVSGALKSVLRLCSGRDPVDAARDAELLALTLERVADEQCGRWSVWEAADGP